MAKGLLEGGGHEENGAVRVARVVAESVRASCEVAGTLGAKRKRETDSGFAPGCRIDSFLIGDDVQS